MNRYDAADGVPPGWTEWYGAHTPGSSWTLSENGESRSYQQDNPGAPGYRHWEDVLGDKAVGFIERHAVSEKPFFMWYGTHAPHSPELVPPRHRHAYANAPLPRPSSFNEKDVSDKPQWIRNRRPLTSTNVLQLTAKHRDRLRSLLSVAENLRRMKDALAQTGELDNTYVIFTSDHGYHMGQHRLGAGKMTAYEEDIGVPLAVEGPGVPTGSVDHMTLNTDFAPTIADLARVQPPYATDGRSFAPLLAGDRGGIAPLEWRKRFMAENWKGPIPGGVWPAPTNRAVRTSNFLYNRYVNGEKEFYRLKKDPFELRSNPGGMTAAERSRFDDWWRALVHCRGAGCRRAEG